MKQIWKLFWDISATIFGIYIGIKVFLFSGSHIPAFGYFPIGVILALPFFGIGLLLIHGVQLFFSWILFILLKIRVEDDLPF